MPLISLSMQDKISKAIEENEYSIGIFFDLAKPFDTVNRAILLQKTYYLRGPWHPTQLIYQIFYKVYWLAEIYLLPLRITWYSFRYMARVPYGAHTKSIFTELQFLRLVQIRLVQIGEFMFRYEHGLLPPTFNNFFRPSSTIHSHQTRGSNLYYKPFARF